MGIGRFLSHYMNSPDSTYINRIQCHFQISEVQTKKIIFFSKTRKNKLTVMVLEKLASWL